MYYTYRPLGTADIFALLAATATWIAFWWVFLSKLGYRHKVRWFLLVGMCIPLIAPIEFLALLALPCPVWTEVRRLRKQIKELNQPYSVDAELEKLRKRMNG
jgi:hypothetical protein